MSTPAPGPRVVAVHEVIEGWDHGVRASFAFWVGQMAPELVDEYDGIIRRLETAQAERYRTTGRLGD